MCIGTSQNTTIVMAQTLYNSSSNSEDTKMADFVLLRAVSMLIRQIVTHLGAGLIPTMTSL